MPLYHLFGSESFSLLTTGVAERAPKAYLALNASEAQKLGVAEGDHVSLQLEDAHACFPLKIIDSLPEGTFGLPVGLAGGLYLQSPTFGRLSKNDQEK